MILAGDIGGTKTALALYDVAGGALRLVRESTYPSQTHASLEEILVKFLTESQGITLQAGSFGVAGPVIDGKCKTTNLPWHLDEIALASAIGAPRVKLLNDLETAAFGMLFLQPSDLVPINHLAKPRRDGNIAVVAAGTGLGEAILYWDGQRYHPIATEGGHTDFAPTDDREIELLRFLRDKHGAHVSYERILSGPGFYDLFCFLRQHGEQRPTPALLERLQGNLEDNAVVSELAITNSDPLCTATVDLFAKIYGAEAGNLALKCLSHGGVFLGGGIGPRILPILKKGAFLSAFLDKGRFRSLLEAMPVQVSLNSQAPLLGAAHYAARMLS